MLMLYYSIFYCPFFIQFLADALLDNIRTIDSPLLLSVVLGQVVVGLMSLNQCQRHLRNDNKT